MSRETNIQLPAAFIEQTKPMMGETLWADFIGALAEEPPVSIRLNPLKTSGWTVAEGEAVPWCRGGYYLSRRPQFTFDPLLHAGAYYVQEASSMFLDEVLRQHLPASLPCAMALDLCAAPGGKSTVLRAALPTDCMLISNEPNPKRVQILAENIHKWGAPNCVVTNNYPRDFSKSGLTFDLILTDVPCSGEGMFRKDEGAIGEWSAANVEKCRLLQREIVGEAWACLRPGGLLVYSTCTFNTRENEENVRWMTEQWDAELLPVAADADWHITGSLLPGFNGPVSRFIPGRTRGEGLFMAVLRKRGGHAPSGGGRQEKMLRKLNVVYQWQEEEPTPRVELTYEQALQYLRREALTLPADAPRGLLTVTYQGLPLGLAKNIGNRANNLYPKEWRIKSTHLPAMQEVIRSDK